MRRITSATAIAMLCSFAFVSAPVLADCAADIETIEEELDSGTVSKMAEAEVRAARNMVKKAKAALAEGKKKKCENLVKKAQDKLGNS
jgi:ATP/maltotriose-dependent transcriptional regulator MalT